MAGNHFILFFLLFFNKKLSCTITTKHEAVSMVWNNVGTGCFEYDFYRLILAENKEACLQSCMEDVKCAFVAWRRKKRKCALCTDGYLRKTSCAYHVQLIAKDVNECAVKQDNCEENSVCINTPGSFKCRCKTGYYKESGHCVEVPYVEWISRKDSCLEVTSYFAIIETLNADKCKLKCQTSDYCMMVQYQTHDKKCKMAKHRKFRPIPGPSCKSRTDIFVKAIIECDNIDKLCPRHAYCHSKEGNRKCRCRFGYKGNGKICYDVDECATYENLCGQHARCRNIIGSYKCVCLEGYHGDGQICRKDSIKNKEVANLDKNDKGVFHTIINLFNESGSHRIVGCSQMIAIVVLLLCLYTV